MCIPIVKCNKWVMSSVHHRVTHSVPLGVNETSQVKLCLIKIPLCRTRPATHVLFCKRPERMKAACGAEMIKQISRTSFSSASKIVLGLLVILGKINTGTPAILGLLERLRGWLCIALRATRFLFQRTFCCFLKKRSARNRHYKQRSFREMHELRTDCMEKGINTSAAHPSQGSHFALCSYSWGKCRHFPEGSCTPSFSLLRTFSSGQALSSGGCQEPEPRQGRFPEQNCTNCLNAA